MKASGIETAAAVNRFLKSLVIRRSESAITLATMEVHN